MAEDGRFILHVDMDAFFAAVEQLDNPALRGKPVLVGWDGPRGVVAAASYEARVYGCRSAQPMGVAKRNCPQAIIVPGRFQRYREISGRMFAILERYTPAIEPLSIDEAFLDVTGSIRLRGPAEEIAQKIRNDIRSELSLTASVGVAPNKFLAKLASDMNKPDGLTVIAADEVERILSPLPIGRIWGIGPKTAERFHAMQIRTIGDLRQRPLEWVREWMGEEAEHYWRLAHGQDERDVVADSEAKSIGQEQTFGVDIAEPEEIRRVMMGQTEHVAARMRRHGYLASTVTVKIRFGDFKTVTRSQTLKRPTDATKELWAAAEGLFNNWARAGFQPVRLIGVSASNFTQGEAQPELFVDADHERQRKVDRAVDAINAKFGKLKLRRGRAIGKSEKATDGDD